MKCPKCGKEVHDGELFCGNCGYNLAQNNKPSVQTKTQVKKQIIQIKLLSQLLLLY